MPNDLPLVQHKSVSILARVIGPDPADIKRVMIRFLTGGEPIQLCEGTPYLPIKE
jgi:hypothetical protein